MNKRNVFLIVLVSLFLMSVVVWTSDQKICDQAGLKLFTNVDSIPENKAGLLLGTSKYLKSGKLNQYFEYRILAAEKLFKSRKISNIVISGDNSRVDYNEPQDMKDELMKRGVPEENIYLDYAGFRTFDSVYRMKAIFGQERFTVISQKFHNERAVYIAESLTMDALGFNAADVDAYNGFKTQLREKFARVKVMIDFAINTKPKFEGEKVLIQ
ncbi:MAG: YdcF family protein [Bacteroidia bacterium]|nr:YdcF family protein [Bacteroidia bacterium]